MSDYTWQVSTQSIQGASHIRQNLPNQDACASYLVKNHQLPLIMAVADGHGSKKSFRSERGARLAVEQALQVMQDFVNSQPRFCDVQWQAEETLSKRLVQHWRQAVEQDVAQQPFLAEHEALLPSNKEPYLAYGSTLLIAVMTDVFILLMQLGDGDILQILPCGTVQRPILADARLLGNETTSLCTKDAWRQFRCSVQAPSNQVPNLWLLATDGYANSFSSASHFEQVGTDLLLMIQQSGFDLVMQHLPDWLKAASQQGSGDDVTVALAYQQAIKPVRYVLASQRKTLLPRKTSSMQQRKQIMSKRVRRNLTELSQLLTECIKK